MSRFHSYLNSTVQILTEYDGKSPFSLFLRKFFSHYKKYGSRDRRLISDYCYQYFRIGKAFANHSIEERILIGRFLCSTGVNRMLEVHKPEWNDKAGLNLHEKLEMLHVKPEEVFSEIFRWGRELSPEIDSDAFAKSHLLQPNVFLRIRPNKKETVKLKLKGHHISFKEISNTTLAVEPNSKIDQVLKVDSEVVVQDLSSQRVGEYLAGVLEGDSLKVWDCCAASGGKSIMAYDINPSIQLTVSDVRENILFNLEKRFEAAEIKNYKSVKLDLSNPESIPDTPFDVIIADVPCTGSGTWGRTPEQLSYFETSKIKEYVDLQRKIVSNAIPNLKPGGYLVYITCSVFKKENEENVEYLANKFDLKEVGGSLLKGYDQKADSMFVSLLKKSF